jgi:hypothetical protein
MKKNYFVISAIFFQIITGIVHSISFFAPNPAAANDTEKQLQNLVDNYKMDLGAGYHQTLDNLFLSVSVCMTLLCLLAGTINWLLYKKKVDAALMKGILLINAISFGIAFIVMLRFAFLLPIICMGLIFTSCAAAWATTKK